MRPGTSSAPRERETAQEIATGRLNAGKQLFYLFGGTDAAGTQYDGVLHQSRIADLEKSDPKWKTYLDGVRKDPHAKTLAVISSARNDPKFLPALVAELFSDPTKGHDPVWFAGVFLAGAAEIFAATGTGLILPTFHASLDLERSAFNLVDHLSDEERNSLGLFMPEEAPKRQLATTLAGLLTEAEAAIDEPGLTAAQRFFRWTVRSWEDRKEADEERKQKRAAGGGNKGEGRDPARILPPAPSKSVPAPPQVAADPVLPPVLTAKPNGAAAAEAPTPPAPVTAAPAAPAQTNEGQVAVIEALKSSGLEGKAFAILFSSGKRTYEQVLAFAESKGLL